MPICIICREQKEVFSVEHVIPESIGGLYTIHSVCKECNPIMGNSVDNKLVDHLFSKHIRFLDGIKGKTGKNPNPFEGIHYLEKDQSRKFHFLMDEDKNIKPYMLPKTKEEKISKNEYRITISVDDKDMNKVDEILKKKMQRLGLNTNQIISREAVTTKKKGMTFLINNHVDLEEYKICLLKIAYEFAMSEIPNYIHDEMAVEISQILKNAIYDQVTKYVNIGDGFTKTLLNPLSEYLDFESKRHNLILLNFNDKLYCLLSIFNIFVAGIQLSNKSYLSELDTIICINDYIKKICMFTTLFDIINNPANCSYIYALKFVSENERIEFTAEEKKDNSPFFSNEKGFLLYDHSGEKILTDETSLLIDFYSNRLINNYIGIQTEIPVPDGYFVKMKSSNKTIQLLKIIEERKKC